MNFELGKRIKKIREENHLSQETVAEQLNISRQKLARIESGKNDITFSFLDAFSKIVGITVSDITGDLSSSFDAKTAFRSEIGNKNEAFAMISDMLDLFYANKHLYNRTQE